MVGRGYFDLYANSIYSTIIAAKLAGIPMYYYSKSTFDYYIGMPTSLETFKLNKMCYITIKLSLTALYAEQLGWTAHTHIVTHTHTSFSFPLHRDFKSMIELVKM